MSLRTRLLVWLGLPILVAFFALITLNYYLGRQKAVVEMNNYLTQLAGKKAEETNSYFKALEGPPKTLAAILASTPPGDDESYFTLLEQSIATSPEAIGAAAAYDVGKHDPNRRLFAPYAAKSNDGTYSHSLIEPAAKAYDYTTDTVNASWFITPMNIQ